MGGAHGDNSGFSADALHVFAAGGCASILCNAPGFLALGAAIRVHHVGGQAGQLAVWRPHSGAHRLGSASARPTACCAEKLVIARHDVAISHSVILSSLLGLIQMCDPEGLIMHAYLDSTMCQSVECIGCISCCVPVYLWKQCNVTAVKEGTWGCTQYVHA